MPRFILSACCLVLLSLTAARAEDFKPLAEFSMGPDSVPFVTLSFGGNSYRCVLDTGSNISFLNQRFQPQLGKPSKERDGTPLYALPEAMIGRMRIPPGWLVACFDLAKFDRGLGANVDGIIGMDILSRIAVSFDFDQGVVRLHKPTYEPTERVETVPLALELQVPYAKVEVGGQNATLAITTGTRSELGLQTTLLERLCERGAATVVGRTDTYQVGGAERANRTAFLSEMGLGQFRHRAVLCSERPTPNDANRRSMSPSDGDMGWLFLARYNSALLFPKNELVLSKSKWHDAVYFPAFRGLRIAKVGDRFVVFSVQANSPASKAGIQPNDEVEVLGDSWPFGGAGPFVLKTRRTPADTFREIRLD